MTSKRLMKPLMLIAVCIGLGGCLTASRQALPPADADGRLGGLDRMLAPALNAIDARRFSEALLTALEFGRPGGPVAWRNPDSGTNGDVIAAAARQVGGRTCRDVTATTVSGTSTEVRRATACSSGGARWERI